MLDGLHHEYPLVPASASSGNCGAQPAHVYPGRPKDPSYCHKIKTQDLGEACLAQLKGETYGCFRIENPDARAACLGETTKDDSYSFKIQGADDGNACLADVKADRSYCFKIQGKDLRNHCLATAPR